MPKQTQSKSLGNVKDFVSRDPEPDTDRITSLEKRVSTLELLLNDVMHQLDQPVNKPSQKKPVEKKRPRKPSVKQDSPKPTPPSEIIADLLKTRPLTATEIEAETGMTPKAVQKCLNWMLKNDIIEADDDQYKLRDTENGTS